MLMEISRATKFDEYDLIAMPIGPLFVRYLMSSYLYYVAEMGSPWDDSQFDQVCKRLLDEWDTLEHSSKHQVTIEDLKAGTGFSIKYPHWIPAVAEMWLQKVGVWYDTGR